MNRIERDPRIRSLAAASSAVAFVVAVAKKFGDDQAGNLVALLADYASLATFPLLLALTTIRAGAVEISAAPAPRSSSAPAVAGRWPGMRSRPTAPRDAGLIVAEFLGHRQDEGDRPMMLLPAIEFTG